MPLKGKEEREKVGSLTGLKRAKASCRIKDWRVAGRTHEPHFTLGNADGRPW